MPYLVPVRYLRSALITIHDVRRPEFRVRYHNVYMFSLSHSCAHSQFEMKNKVSISLVEDERSFRTSNSTPRMAYIHTGFFFILKIVYIFLSSAKHKQAYVCCLGHYKQQEAAWRPRKEATRAVSGHSAGSSFFYITASTQDLLLPFLLQSQSCAGQRSGWRQEGEPG